MLQGVQAKLYGEGLNMREHHARAVLRILETDIPGRIYLIGADGERGSFTVLRMILRLMDRKAEDFNRR